MATRELQVITIKLGDTAPGGFAGMDANNQIIPNGADPVNPQDLATRNYVDNADNVPTNTVYVRTASDFGSTVDISGNDYHDTTPDTQYIMLENLLMTAGVIVATGTHIRSGNREQATFDWQGFTNASPILYSGSGKGIFDNIRFINNAGALNSPFIFCSSGLGSFDTRNCVFEGFDNIFFGSGTPSIVFENNVGTAITGLGILLDNVAESIIDNNTLSLSGASAKAIEIEGFSVINSRVSDNTCENGSSFFVDVNSSITSLSRIAFTGNKVSNPANFFDPSGLTQTDARIYTSGNLEVVNSKAFMSATDTLSSTNTITINTVNVSEQVTSRVIQANSLNRFFNVTNPGIPPNEVPTIQYVGSATHYFTVTIRCLLMSVGAQKKLSLGLWLNGGATGFTFSPTETDVTGHTYVNSSILLLAPNDFLTFAVLNSTDAVDIVVGSLGIAVSQIT